MLNVTLVGEAALMARLRSMPERVRQALVKKITALALKLEGKVKRDKLSGQVLHVKTGALRRSIFHKVEQSSTGVTGKVASSGDVKYAGIHEFGGRTKAHVIEPRKAQALAWKGKGGRDSKGRYSTTTTFARRVNHPGSQMPERSFLRSSLRDMQGEITVGLRDAVVEGMNKQ